MESRRLHGVQVEQTYHYHSSSISLGDTLHVSVHKTTCFRVLGLRREEPTTTNSSSNIPYLAHIVPRTAAAAGTVEVATNGSCTNRHTNTRPRSTPKTTETGDASRGRLSLDDIKRSLTCLVRRMLCLQFALFFLSFFRARVVASFRFPTSCLHMPC